MDGNHDLISWITRQSFVLMCLGSITEMDSRCYERIWPGQLLTWFLKRLIKTPSPIQGP